MFPIISWRQRSDLQCRNHACDGHDLSAGTARAACEYRNNPIARNEANGTENGSTDRLSSMTSQVQCRSNYRECRIRTVAGKPPNEARARQEKSRPTERHQAESRLGEDHCRNAHSPFVIRSW
jgi:hypothetical protein